MDIYRELNDLARQCLEMERTFLECTESINPNEPSGALKQPTFFPFF